MGKLIDDLMHLEADLRHMHTDVEHMRKDPPGFDESSAIRDLLDHLRDLDARGHALLSHVGHIRMETETR